jgi:tetratricopeptide (TPR) repeat protein
LSSDHRVHRDGGPDARERGEHLEDGAVQQITYDVVAAKGIVAQSFVDRRRSDDVRAVIRSRTAPDRRSRGQVEHFGCAGQESTNQRIVQMMRENAYSAKDHAQPRVLDMSDVEARFPLPPIPSEQSEHPVAAWSEPVSLRTYEPGTPERLPAFLESRVYQGSSGRVYPLPFIESISHEPSVRSWQAVHIENEFVRLVILPELGGRVHIAIDKVTGLDFFYRNNSIKPALVGLAGPWISGGIEFNWPQHHRPATFLPMDWTIENEADGSVTVWCSDHDPFSRMKGMHGIRLRPGSSVIEARVRLFNRTEVTQTFLWWANVAVRVHDEYQSFFPSDVHVVADHAKRAATAFPAADRPYYGIDYPTRSDAASSEYAGADADRLDWYRNIPVPTSYMCVASNDDFFGGYDHAAGLGFAHVADHRIAPGKKQWTWGNSPFGWAWDANLSDGDGPYVELMAGVYTDNQPDFSYLTPGETKTFSQYWFPYHGIGPLSQATTEVALRLGLDGDEADRVAVIGVAGTSRRPAVRVRLADETGATLWESVVALAPGTPLVTRIPAPGRRDLELIVTDGAAELAHASTRYRDASSSGFETATEPPAPDEIASIDELYLTGVHLAQYRHATRSPEPYWDEALRRDPGDSRTNVAVAATRLNAGRLIQAEAHLRAALARQTGRNPNPSDGEASYLLGVVLQAQGRDEEAADAFGKAMWNSAWRSSAQLALARIAARNGRWQEALDNAEAASRTDADQLQTLAVRICALRRLAREQEASTLLTTALTLDPLDTWLRDLAGSPLAGDAGTLRDIAGEYRSLGLIEDALRVLDAAADAARTRPVIGAGDPLVLINYTRAELLDQLGRADAAADALASARDESADRCFASGLADAQLLERRIEQTDDAQAHALLGHWLYFHRRYDDAIGHLERADALRPGDPVVLRGLGLAAHNVRGNPQLAVEYYRKALAADPTDAKLRYESDQLARRVGVRPEDRLADLEGHPELLVERDDLALAYAELLVLVGRDAEAIGFMNDRRFSPWEGGEGETIRVWALAQRAVAERARADGRPHDAVAALRLAIEVPGNLGEARHPLANNSDILLALGDAASEAGLDAEAATAWRLAADSAGDFTTMVTVPHSPMTYYSVLAALRLGDNDRADRLTKEFKEYVELKRLERPTIDYFATSLPTMLIFWDDLVQTQQDLVTVMDAQLALLGGEAHRAQALLGPVADRNPANPLVRELMAEPARTPAA